MAISAEEARQAIDPVTTSAALADLQNQNANLRSQNARLAAAHEQSHGELANLRAMVAQGGGTRPDRRLSLLDPRAMIPNKFGAKGPGVVEWRDWSYEARHYIVRVDARLPEILQSVETRKEPLTETDVVTTLGVSAEVDADLRQFLVNRTEGEARQLVRGSDSGPGVEIWRLLASHFDPLAAPRVLNESRAVMAPPRAKGMEDLAGTIQAWENLERRVFTRTGKRLPADMRMSILAQMCPADLARELLPQQHLFPRYDALRNHIIGLVHSRTTGVAPMILSLDPANGGGDDAVEGEDGELYRLERRDGKVKMIKAGTGKGAGRGARKCFRCGREGHIRPDCNAKTHIDGGAPRPPPRTKGAGSLDTDVAPAANGEESNVGLGLLELNALAVAGNRRSQQPRAAAVAAASTPKKAERSEGQTPTTHADSRADPWSDPGSDPWRAWGGASRAVAPPPPPAPGIEQKRRRVGHGGGRRPSYRDQVWPRDASSSARRRGVQGVPPGGRLRRVRRVGGT